MRRFAKLLIVAVLAALAGTFGLLPSQGQVGGPPPGVIIKNPAESELSITVEMGHTLYVQNTTAVEFVRFRINQSAFVYLYEVAPNGEVRLLLPNRAARNNFLASGEYAFPEDFQGGFPIGAEGEGRYTIQAIATLLPIELGPGVELFQRLGSNPDQVRQGVELLIAQSGLTATQWAANWTQYRVVKTQPTAGGTGKVTLKVVDNKNTPISDALVKIEQIDAQGNPVKVELDWRTVDTGLSWRLESGVRYRMLAKRPPLYVPDPQTVCKISKGGLETTLAPCEFELVPNDDLLVTFTLEPASEAVDFRVSNPKGSNPYCVGIRIEFDASASRPGEQILSYQWDFGDGTTKLEKESSTSHIYRHPKKYQVTLVVTYQGGRTKSTMKTIEVAEATHPRCPPLRTATVEEKAKFELRPPNTIAFEVRNGYAIVPVPNLSLPPGSPGIRLSFQYLITAFPTQDVLGAKAFVLSYVSVLFLDAQGNTLAGAPQTVLYAIEAGKLPTLLQPQEITSILKVPDGAKGMQVLAVTSVLATAEATEDPVVITYSGFQLAPTSGINPDPCATLASGRVVGGQFLGDQFFRWGEPIAFRFSNTCSQAIALRSEIGWWRIIDTLTGRELFRTVPTAVSVPAGQSLVWTWDQRNAQGQFIEANRIYRVEVETQAGAIYSALFGIVF